MKNKTFNELIQNPPYRVDFKDIVDFENFDERLSAIDCIVVNIIGVEEGYIEFIPNELPATADELYCWIWAFRPDLSEQMLKITTNEDFKLALQSYLNHSMDDFYNAM